MQQIEDLDDILLKRLAWLCLKKEISNKKDIPLSELARKIYDNSLLSFNTFYQIHTYSDYLSYTRSNLHGGCNDKYITKYENLFRQMYPDLKFQQSYGTGKDGYKKYGVKRYIADFVDNDCKVIIEIDGDNHTKELQKLKDKIRDIFFLKEGYTTIRFSNDEVLKLYKVYCNKIAKEIEDEYAN